MLLWAFTFAVKGNVQTAPFSFNFNLQNKLKKNPQVLLFISKKEICGRECQKESKLFFRKSARKCALWTLLVFCVARLHAYRCGVPESICFLLQAVWILAGVSIYFWYLVLCIFLCLPASACNVLNFALMLHADFACAQQVACLSLEQCLFLWSNWTFASVETFQICVGVWWLCLISQRGSDVIIFFSFNSVESATPN